MKDLAGAPTERTALSRELGELLIELSIGVHRYAMYPMGHPSLEPVADNILGRLAVLFRERASLAIGVAARQLVIEGVATDQRHPVLADLARRLHDHQLGAISFRVGVTSHEIGGLLEALARDVERGGEPLGLMPVEVRPSWTNAHLHPVGYDRLEMREGATGEARLDRATALWIGLAQAALSGADEVPANAGSDPDTLARSIREHEREAAYDQVIVGYLLQLAEELKGPGGGESEQVRRKMSRLVRGLDEETLTRLVRFGGDRAQRRRFLLDANQTLSAESVVKLLKSAAGSEQQSISHAMTRMLTKLSTHAAIGRGQARQEADSALREHVEALIGGWDLADPNPEAYTSVLDAMAKAAPVFYLPEEEIGGLSGPDRLLAIAMELDAWGPMVQRALDQVLEERRIADFLESLMDGPVAHRVAFQVLGQLTEPERFRELLRTERLDARALRILTAHMGEAAIEPMLDVLVDSDSRAVRQGTFQVLREIGPQVAVRAIRRLDDPRWLVPRTMLALLGRLPDVPPDFDPTPFLGHPDVRVRREALPLALRLGRTRDRTVAGALSDPDDRMALMGLMALREGVPDAVVPTLVHRVVTNLERSPEVRALGVRMLATVRSPLALNTLLDVATAGRSFFGKRKLAPTAPDVLVALRGLSLLWSDRDEADELLEQAARSKDPEVRAAIDPPSAAAGPVGEAP